MRHAPFSTASPRIAAVLALLLATGLLSGCQTDGVPPSPLAELAAYNGKQKEAAKPAEPPMTRSRAAMECWMKTEKGRADTNLDKRADVVTKCIDEKLKTVQATPKT